LAKAFPLACPDVANQVAIAFGLPRRLSRPCCGYEDSVPPKGLHFTNHEATKDAVTRIKANLAAFAERS
jgi:hypothetical protein